jgi:NTP pyrophosphatase (non-canonical NTP hydrolase)
MIKQETQKKLSEFARYAFENNTTKYNILKAVEELNELSTRLMQNYNKPHKADAQATIEEIGDVIIRIEVLKKIFPINSIEDRIEYKLGKFESYKSKYENI